MNSKKVVAALSGGLDSSMAAYLLHRQGYEVLGVFLRMGLDKDVDEDHARRVCEFLGIKFYPVDISRQFQQEVVDYFVDSYARGFTPNPCIKCNQTIKFAELIKLADGLGYDRVATGHYVRLKKEKGVYQLYKGKDPAKDQSYFLYRLTQSQLNRIIFPLGRYHKEEIRKKAEKIELPFYDSESQDICFITGDHNEFLKQKLNLQPGPIKTRDGRVVGEHQGLPLYTLGQRRGVNVGGIGPLYVVQCDYKNNILYVTDDSEDPALYSRRVQARECNWIAGTPPETPLSCQAMVRYGQKPHSCRIQKTEEGKCEAEFDSPQRAVTPGQSIVFYDGDKVLGGGVIMENP